MKPWKTAWHDDECQVARACFNGATAMKPWKRTVPRHGAVDTGASLQWGHGDEAVEEDRLISRPSPGTVELQWGHGDEAVEEATQPRRVRAVEASFNGATAMKPWKRVAACRACSGRGCFNGATAMKPWKRIDLEAVARCMKELQWGHGDEAVEEFFLAMGATPGLLGFNGATAMKPWKRSTSRLWPCA